MASLTITVPDAIAPQVLNDFALFYGYTGTDPNNAPETKVQFAQRTIRGIIATAVQSVERRQAAVAAANATDATTAALVAQLS